MNNEKPVVKIRAGRKTDIPAGEGRAAVWGGHSIAVFHTEKGEIFAVENKCPHRGGPLSDGLLGGDNVICPIHGLEINLPTGKVKGKDLYVATYEVKEENGDIYIMVRP